MDCPDFEDVLQEGPRGHAAHCEECRALLEAWSYADAALEAEFAGLSAPASLPAAVRARVRERNAPRLTFLPEILDFVGWAAVLAILALLAPVYIPGLLG